MATIKRSLLLAALLASGCARHAAKTDGFALGDHVRLGATYAVKGLPDSARREYEAALALDQGCAPAWVGLGNLAFEHGEYRKAQRLYRKALKTDPGHPSANNNLAMIMIIKRKRNMDDALQMALTALPRSGRLRPYVLDTLAQVYMRQGRYPLAKAALDEAEQNAPEDERFRKRLLESRRSLEALAKRSVYFPFNLR
jgi:tetratricopeptide (TPR) repeat protein